VIQPNAPTSADSPTAAIEPLAMTASQIAEQGIVPVSLRTWRRMDSAGKCPRGLTCGGRKVWRLSDLRLWAEWDFPDRRVFEARLRLETPKEMTSSRKPA